MMPYSIFYMISLGLLFVMFVTGAYKKSISTTLMVIVMVIMFYSVTECGTPKPISICKLFMDELQFTIVTLLGMLAVMRAILQKERDRMIR